MAYGIVHHFKGGTKEQYDATLAKVHPDGGKGLPGGQTYHAAGAVPDGWVVVAIWNSKADYEKFRDNELGPALGSLGDKGLPGPPTEHGFDLHNEKKG